MPGRRLATVDTGSSPRGRGKLGISQADLARLRLIPARAGKTRRSGSLSPPPSAHPRAGGENNLRASPGHCSRGSSPRGRGKPTGPPRPASKPRLIPARAGKTTSQRRSGHARTAHPRAGGENNTCLRASVDTAGSSPRGRGKLVVLPTPPFWFGLIPARAGKTGRVSIHLRLAWAHPRAGGENFLRGGHLC